MYRKLDIVALKKIRSKILEVASISKEGHIPSSFSVLEILFSFYKQKLFLQDFNEVEFVLSKGHAALGLYSVLNHFGLISDEELDSYCKYDSNLGGHPDSTKIPEILTSTGSLGHGLPFATGIAYANAINKRKSHIYVLIGDGELNEGSNWESLLLIEAHQLTNVSIILDANLSSDRALKLKNLRTKFESFGFLVSEINGHNLEEIDKWFQKSVYSREQHFLIANTIKGHGVSDMENNPAWHHRIPNEIELKELKAAIK